MADFGAEEPAHDLLPFTVVGAWWGGGMDEGVWNNSFVEHVTAKNAEDAAIRTSVVSAQNRMFPVGDEPTQKEIQREFDNAEVIAVFEGHIFDKHNHVDPMPATDDTPTNLDAMEQFVYRNSTPDQI